MKKIACAKIGGGATNTCDFVVSAETEEVAVDQWHGHFKETHPEVIADVSEEDKKKWMEGHHKVWEETAGE